MEQPRSAPARPLWDRIQAICAERGWSTVRLERETGVSRQTIAKWKTQPRAPQAATVNTVARVLGIEQEEALRLAGILSAEDETQPTALPPTVQQLAEQVARMQERIDELETRISESDQAKRREIS